MTSRMSCIALLLASTALAQSPAYQVNEDCTNAVHLGMNASGGRVDAFGGAFGSDLCSDNEKRRLAFHAEASVIKITGTDGQKQTSQSREIEASHERRFGKGWFTVIDVSHEADNSQGLESRNIVAPGVGAGFARDWGTSKFEVGVARTWENIRGEPRKAFPEAWASSTVGWKIRPNISLKENLEFYASMEDSEDYRYSSRTDLSFRMTSHLSLRTGFRYDWDHKPARGYDKTDWKTSTLFVFAWGER